ncbi:J domain-containing protein [Actinotignum urinale]|uniref:J domain-containing protein n=1 Tax=Actinotignum urinale TaxID=190146 RepID=A0AAW9HN33_9ACTO|nr:J domain-containing protein [Actinotignum urinale]MDY5128566.1 J domain-containing protein [Actinotignum urinale]MDY5151310.1 J domain-containing protein [Actinotignum urinale]MDY5155071.1 J domain-containing protein [Actinotignum urinale]MDY5160655.1 J domain-containing protein [Actinotignum urinale]WIK59486.1 J domain-containing protein [Actinotignum urinale]
MAGASQDWLEKDFYAELGVAKDATQEEIKKAYRKLSRKHHPDRNGGSKESEEKFKRVGEAYQVLSNPEDRKQYDAIRSLGAGGPRFRAGSGAGAGAGGFEDIFSMFGGAGARNARTQHPGGFEDILSNMFGNGGNSYNFSTNNDSTGGFGGFGGFSSRPQKGADITATVSIPLRKAVDGTTIKLNTASGKSVTARIPQGVSDGQKIRIPGKGNPGVKGGAPGDIIVTVNVEPHPIYELKGKDVYVNLPVSFTEAALGATVEVPVIDGGNVKVKIPAGSSTDKILRVRGKGIPKKDEHGDMYVRIKVVVPTKLSEDAKKAAELFGKATSEADPRADFIKMAHM